MDYKSASNYFNGKYVSRKSSIVLSLSLVMAVFHVIIITITFLSDKADHVGEETTVLVVFLIASCNLFIIYCLLLIQGFLERNILQIFISTFFSFCTSFLLSFATSYLNKPPYAYLYSASNFMTIAFTLFIIYLTIGLRSEYGWFYYKAYGPNPRYNRKYTIRKTMDIMYKIMLQVAISFWMIKFLLETVEWPLVLQTIAYILIIVCYTIEYYYESYILRALNILMSGWLVSYYIWELSDFENVILAVVEYNEILDLRLFWLTQILLRIVIQVIYTLFLVLDVAAFGYGLNGYYRARQKKRVSIIAV
ncbi:hypothetical protein NEOKW01_1375 [Nematocida sp. AWRm80]|nr:hypothetical protein NEOKW01_1375 [Nematocida sp. AWRm80]